MMVLTFASLALVIAAAGWDLRRREVPDLIPCAVLACAVVGRLLGSGAGGWLGLCGGLALGLLLTVPLFFLGGLGGGDVKLIAALGAVLGPLGLLSALFWTALAGGVLAILAALRGRRDFAYVPAIAAGMLLHVALAVGGGAHALAG